MCVLRRDFLLIAIGLAIPEPIGIPEDAYDDPALSRPRCRCGEVRPDYLEFVMGPQDHPDSPTWLQCCSCWHVFDPESHFYKDA